MAIQVPSPSSYGFAREPKFRYDVFLSFRGEDTRHSFTVILYDALRRKGINAFIDDKKLGKGERISPALLKAIEKSRVSIIVFSMNYATSTWCLEELTHIIRCKKEKNQLVMPIFYKVDPMDVQYQRNSFGEAMAAHEDRFRNDLEKVRRWRFALSEAASLSSAWLFKDGYEFGFIERIVEDACARLPPKRFHNTDYMVGLEPRIEKVMSLLGETDDRVCMLGIHGTGGIGKTTLAKALYNTIFYQFEGACFLFDVREESTKYHGMVRLQQTLLSEILEEKRIKFSSVDEGISILRHRLSHKKVLLVLDDVDQLDQLEQLAGGCDWFGCGSKVIITTRNKQLLVARDIEKTYEMTALNDYDSLELFCWHAFHLSHPPKGYQDMASHAIRYAQGLPLALRLIGSNLAHRNLEEWRSTLEQYERIPERTIHNILKMSYDCLQDNAKRIFLDIACFFKAKTFVYIEDIIEAFDFGGRFYFEVLVEKSLVTISGIGKLCMHDLIQQMGREIVRQEAPSSLDKRSRIWYYKDVLKVLCENLGNSNIEGIMLDPPQQEEVRWNGMAFEKMTNLRILVIRNTQFSTYPKYLPNSLRLLDWEGYPSANLPPDFSPKKLISLKLCNSIFRLEEPFKRFECVTYMNVSHCEFITEVPDMSQFPNLKNLLFRECCNLNTIHYSVGSLSKLVHLDVSNCNKLTSFPHEINMPSLQDINLSRCKSLDYFPHIVGKMDALTDIWAEDTAIKELPPSIGNLTGLECLNLSSCKSLRELPNSLFTLQNLEWLELRDSHPPSRKSLMKLMQERLLAVSCANIKFLNLENCCLLDEDLILILKFFRDLQELTLSGNDFVSLPECVRECAELLKLEVDDCKKLRDIPELPSKLSDIKAENCTSLTTKSFDHLWSQVKNEIDLLRICMPATTFPDWLDDCCKGGTLSFHARGNFPRAALACELGKADRRGRHFFHVSVNINGHEILRKQDVNYGSTQGHVFLFDLRWSFEGAEWKRLDRHLNLDWNDVEIQVTCLTPNLPVVCCGIYVYTQHTNMENVQFNSSQLSMNAPTSLKRTETASPPNEPPNKFLRKFMAADKKKTQ
ncbi:TMV resistance protein N-like [Prosopis cineraria]|uniref:TMV resistance protein N-like n=1 Tax=Prosopis cineraria TaxID=364024 RepID=UPI00240F3760|nr:TMV resistance protein N-like [Prosopis cineraria]XP_054779036.1 TMV resistance protein N-like [Prosopis cineraria]XP_054779037.1 TMV resistance protein N-like [Prosopis cineraria]